MTKNTLVVKDFTENFNDVVKGFKRDAVLVGIPASDTERKVEQTKTNEPITNAALLAINEFGSEAAHIPPRPVMKIGIQNAQEPIAEQFKLAAKNALSKGLSALSIYYNRAGLIAANSIKKAINSQEDIEPPSASTIAARQSKGFKGTKALIVTGQMRNAITYVVKGEE